MNKGLEALKIMVKDNDLELAYHNTILTIEKELKALEIIKDMNKIIQEHIEGGEIIICCKTKNDFELLKEVLL